MALVHADSFELYDASTQIGRVYDTTSSVGGTITSGATEGPDGGPGLLFAGSRTMYVQRAVSASGATFIMQADFKTDACASVNVIGGCGLSGSFQCTLAFGSNAFKVYRGSASGALLGTLSYTYTPGAHIYIRFKVVIDSSAGSVRLDVYEAADLTTPAATLTLTSQNTQAGASATWDLLHLGSACDTTNTRWGNYVVMDGSGSALNDVQAPLQARALWARATGALTDFTLSAGSDQAALVDDDTPDDDSTYLESSTLNNQASVYVDALADAGLAVLGAQLYACVEKTSGTPTVTPIARQSGTVYAGSAATPGASYAYAMQAYSSMPNGDAFGATAFQQLQWGVKQSAAGTVRVTQIGVVVLQNITASRRNVLLGDSHSVTGSDNLIVGKTGTVTGDRAVLMSLDGNANSLSEDGKVKIAGKLEVTDTVTVPDPPVNDTDAATKAYVDDLSVLNVRTSDPASPADGQCWFFDDGGSPRSISLRVRQGGVTYDFPIGTETT